MKHSTRVLKRSYNAFVTNEAMEDYSLRYAAKSFRKWPAWILGNTAMGGISFLALEAIGALLVVKYGFANTVPAILMVSAIIFVTGLPITYYSAKYNVDIDLLTRGAGFGYIGSTITSLIYASFTFIFFALEASIMAEAIRLYWGVPLSVGYFLCSVVIIPLVFFGITLINKLQLYTQPLWIVLMVLPYVFILHREPEAWSQWLRFEGAEGGSVFNPLLFGAAMTTAFSLIAQIGEQVDYLRFLPDKSKENDSQWWLAVVLAGPGWILVGALKLLGGGFLAVFAIESLGLSPSRAIEPTYMYLNGFEHVFRNPEIALAVTTVFVVVSQIKINVTNAYAGSLAWSNFFSRITHSHPGRVVWLVFNVVIALLLMQFGLLFTLESVLGVYSNIAVAWIGAIFADLVVLKPLGVSPSYIEFKRAHLYNFNPVGFGAMILASALSMAACFGLLGESMEAFSALLAFTVSFFTALTIAFATRGRYYTAKPTGPAAEIPKGEILECAVCSKPYEGRDVVFCTMYKECVCSLCCSLEIRCKDYCKRKRSFEARAYFQDVQQAIAALPSWDFKKALKRFCVNFGIIAIILMPIFGIFYYHAIFSGFPFPELLLGVLVKIFVFTLFVLGLVAWWLSLSQEHRRLTEDEVDVYILKIEQEVHEHRKTATALQQEKLRTERELARRQQIGAALREAMRRQELILENSCIGIGFVKSGSLVWGNRRFAELSGWSTAEGGSVHERVFQVDTKTYDRIMAESKRVLAMGASYGTEVLTRPGSAGPRWLRLVSSAVDPADVDGGAIWLLDDISERKQAEENLRRSEDRLRDLNERLEELVEKRTRELERTYESLRQADKMASLGILVSGIAHEINNPLGFIQSNSAILDEIFKDVALLLRQNENEHEGVTLGGMEFAFAARSVPKLLRGVREGADRIAGIVNNLRNYSRQTPLEMGGIVDINKALEASLSLLANSIKKSTHRFSVRKGKDLPGFKGDMRAVEQVIINLIQNACQALGHKEQGIRVTTFAPDGTVALAVEDDGEGILEENLNRVNDPFFTTKRDRGGTGLGLAISTRIVEEHGGFMEIQSTPGKGTTVHLLFPALRPHAPKEIQE